MFTKTASTVFDYSLKLVKYALKFHVNQKLYSLSRTSSFFLTEYTILALAANWVHEIEIQTNMGTDFWTFSTVLLPLWWGFLLR